MTSNAESGGRSPVEVDEIEAGAIWRVVLATPKANILDTAKVEVLTDIFRRAQNNLSLKAILIEGEGPHFSFGASVEEHLPEKVETMLRGFHGLFYTMLDSAVVTLAAVRGQCLGGGLELVSFCHRVFVAPDAKLGQPEIVLGVFAPVASVILADRVGRGHAEHLCLSGRSITAEEALSIGLADEIAEDPTEAAFAFARQYLLPRSASSLRMAVRALRSGFSERFRDRLAETERLYLQELMATRDATEGLRAFLERREPQWKDE